MKNAFLEYNGANAAAKVTYTGGGFAVLGGLTANEVASYGGLLLAFIGLIVQICFTVSRHQREKTEFKERKKQQQELHDLKITRIKKELAKQA